MNSHIIDPVQLGDLPDTVGDYLVLKKDDGLMKCVAFNRRGTLLAAGCSNGKVVIWDFLSRGITRQFIDKDCVSSITSVSWSKYGHRILVSSVDKSLSLWDVVKEKKIARTSLQCIPMQAQLHPRSSTPSLCLVCPLESPPIIVNLLKQTIKVLPLSLGGNTVVPPFKPTAACFNKYGDLVYVGNSKGEILIIDHERVEILGVISIPGSPPIKDVVFSRNGQYLLTNSDNGTIQIYDNLLPVKDALKALDKLHQDESSDETEKSRVVGRRCLALSSEIQDTKSKVQWKAPCFSSKGEWVVGGLCRPQEHKMYIWKRDGRAVSMLHCLKEGIIHIAWHPMKPIIVSISSLGFVCIWVNEWESWSAFDPRYIELDQNVEYVEREDEFDEALVPSREIVDEDDIIVDITTIDKDPDFSDSDMSQGEIQYLHDVGEESPLSEDGHSTKNDHASIPPEEDMAIFHDKWEEEEEDVGEPCLSEDGHLTTNDHVSIPPEEDMAIFHDKWEEEENGVSEPCLSEDGHLTTNDHASIPPEEDMARPGKRERGPSRKYWDYYM